MTPNEMREWLAERPRVLDGACGSELVRQGVTAAAFLWGVGALLDATDAVRNLHREYAAAGADALTAATFRVAPYALRSAGLAALAVRLAREGISAAGRNALVFASQTTLEDCYRPDLAPDEATLAREHAATAACLAAAGADALLLETFNTVREARIAAEAATATGLPVLVSFACLEGGRLLSGEDVREAAEAVTVPGVVAVGVNCTAARELMAALVRVAEGTNLPLIAYANNAWASSDSPWLAADPLTPLLYARCALAWAAAGARLVGGCCGAGPEHVAAVASLLRR